MYSKVRTTLNSLNKKDLQTLAYEFNFSTSGDRETLINRLMNLNQVGAGINKDTFERLYKDKLLQKIKENKDSVSGNVSDLIQLFIDSDPTEEHKYLEWLAQGYINNGIKRLEDLKSRALPALKDFILLSNKNILNRGNPSQPWTDQTNIYNFLGIAGGEKKGKKYLGLEELIDSYETQLNQLKGIKEKKIQAAKDSELVFENELVKVYQPKTVEASCRIGAGTKWCTAADTNNKFEEYSKTGPLNIIVPKFPKHEKEKYQFQHETKQYMNEKNHAVNAKKLFKKYQMEHEIKHVYVKTIPLSMLNDINSQTLYLSGKGFTEIPPEIGHLTNLQVLWLSDNQITEIPQEIGLLTNLQKLELNGNQITEIPPEIGHLTNLRILNLILNKITKIPQAIGQLTNLQELYLGYNQITEIPPAIGQLTNLQRLYLHGNQITKIPPEIGRLTNLQKLSLNDNRITKIPPEIGLLTNLRELGLGQNRITEIPPEIGLLTNLQELHLSGNQITEIPPAIGLLTNLQKLWLDVNQITKIPPEIEKLTNLQRLDLEENQITEIPPTLERPGLTIYT